jgi:UDP-N-acetylmuramate dehydrogenase
MHTNVSLKKYTTLKLGGPAAFFWLTASVKGISDAVAYSKEHGLPYFVLGEGSNVLFPDEGWKGLIIQNKLRGITYEHDGQETVFAVAGAGEHWDTFVADTVARGLWGIENLSAIPGTVGATPVQNVGAYGVEVADRIVWIDAYDALQERVVRLAPEACRFSYRDSIFKDSDKKHLIIVAVCFRLSRKPQPILSYRDVQAYFKNTDGKPELSEVRSAVQSIRARKFPDLRQVGTAGSFFKNPIVREETVARLKRAFPELPVFAAGEGLAKISLAWILDRVLHMKGYREGDAGLFSEQPLVLVNYGNATARDMLALAQRVERAVFDAIGVRIVPEVTIVQHTDKKNKT